MMGKVSLFHCFLLFALLGFERFQGTAQLIGEIGMTTIKTTKVPTTVSLTATTVVPIPVETTTKTSSSMPIISSWILLIIATF
ncbi:unnamed protein product [Caenorhabditis sp. 36 PRJEB53466]|nr:unnamed protein product [Caenorhabditis sp. 36 PRJEB53466]